MENGYLYTLQYIGLVNESKDKRFLYNKTIYNMHCFCNEINKFIQIKLEDVNFIKKRKTMPIWGFKFHKEGINLYKYIDYETSKVGMWELIIYKLDDIDLDHNVLSIKKNMLHYLPKALYSHNHQYYTMINLDKVVVHKKFRKVLNKIGFNDVFTKYGEEKFNTDNIVLPRLRTKNIVKTVNAAEIVLKFNKKEKVTEQEFLERLLKEDISFRIGA